MKNRTLTKVLALLLAITVTLGLCACGRKSGPAAASPTKAPAQAASQPAHSVGSGKAVPTKTRLGSRTIRARTVAPL